MEALAALGATPVAAFLRGSATAYLLVNAAHVLGIGLLTGAIVTLDLRLLGAFAAHPLAHLGPPLRRVATAGLALAAATGLLLFSTRPLAYAENPAFLAKMALLGVALLNIALLHAGPRWRAALAGDAAHPRLRAAALVSLLAWPGVLLAGRWIGFLQ
jgi:hypothetical protein